MIIWISLVLFILCFVMVAYLYILVCASIRIPSLPSEPLIQTRFAIAIPAHDEANVIAQTIKSMKGSNYPSELFDIYVVADHCSDETYRIAEESGAKAFERNDGVKGSKGAALAWLFSKIFLEDKCFDAIVIFDADTRIASDFLLVMNRYIQAGYPVLQGQHIISNPDRGWFPALTWAMFMIDNRFQNQGRSNLGFSAKNMGDAICFRADILSKFGWGEGLTEDYAFRQALLLQGIRIFYTSSARSYGQAAVNWQIAQKQRERWLKGVEVSNRQFLNKLLHYGLTAGYLPAIDACVQSIIPSYSTLTIIVGVLMILSLLLQIPAFLSIAWVVLFFSLFLYPLIGLAIERAPIKAYLVILTGPIFILWRTWLKFWMIFRRKKVEWVRTPHNN